MIRLIFSVFILHEDGVNRTGVRAVQGDIPIVVCIDVMKKRDTIFCVTVLETVFNIF